MAMFFAVVLGLPLGVGVALYVMATVLDNSNNFGDTTADINTFADGGIRNRIAENRIKKNSALDSIKNPYILKKDAESDAQKSLYKPSWDNEE